jgi:hypothetical protein
MTAFVLVAVPLHAAGVASLAISSGSGVPGGTTFLNLTLSSSGGAKPVASQWVISYPVQNVSAISLTASAAATNAQKQLSCIPCTTAGKLNCILIGLNQGEIPTGTIATIAVQASASPSSSTIPIGISAVEFSDADGGYVDLSPMPSGGSIALLLPTIQPSSLSCTPSSMNAPGSSTCTVTLTAVAPTGGVTVSLSSSNTGVQVPASVTVPAGSTSRTFTATVGTITANLSSVVTATAGGGSRTFTLSAVAPATLSTLACSPATVLSGQTTICTVTLSKAATSAFAVTLTSSNGTALPVPASVSVPSGSSSASFTATAGTVISNQAATVTATAGGVSRSSTVTVGALPMVSGLVCAPATVSTPGAANCTVTLSAAAPVGGVSVALSSSNAKATLSAANVTVAASATTAAFTLTASAVTTDETAVVTAAANGGSRTFSLTLAADLITPTVAITLPTTAATYATTQESLNLSGTAEDNLGVTQVSWSNDRGGSGLAQGTTNWTISGLSLAIGANVITVTARDAAGNSGTSMITVTATAPEAGQPIAIAVGSTVSGALTTASQLSTRRPGAYAVSYSFQGTAGQTVAITLTSRHFDTYLYLIGPSGTVVDENNDNGTASEARIPAGNGMLTLPQTGLYTIEATSFATNTYGPFTLAVTGPCLMPPRARVGFDRLTWISDPDANGVRLLTGDVAQDRITQWMLDPAGLPLPEFENQRFCGAIEIAPGVRAEVFVPTALEQNGDYSQSGPLLVDPATRVALTDGSEYYTPFPASIVPSSRLLNCHGGIHKTCTYPFAFRIASLLPSAPGVLPVTPRSGEATSQSFEFEFNAAGGYRDLTVVNVLLNEYLDGRQACYLAYVRPLNLLYLANDAGDALLPALELNGAGSVSNSQCTINGAGSSVSAAGHSLKLTLNMSFHSAFAGRKAWYLAARDSAENSSGWQASGTWAVPPVPGTYPSVEPMAPARGRGASAEFTFRFRHHASWQNLSVVNMLLNDFLDGRHACYLAYARTNNTLYLVNDEGTALLPGLAVSGTGALSNSQCAISNPTVTGSGDTMEVRMTITFAEGFVGNRVWHVAAKDTAETSSGWHMAGSWTVR